MTRSLQPTKEFSSAATREDIRPPLREYQRQAVECTLAARDRGDRAGLISVCTGGGKTRIAGELLARLPGRALFLVHTQLLAIQARDALASHTGEPIGIVVDGKMTRADARLIVSTRQSLTEARLAALLDHGPFDTCVIDEAHHAGEGTSYAAIRDVLKARAPELFLLGLTATPWRNDGELLFTKYFFSRELQDMIPLGVIAPVQHVRVELAFDVSRLRLTAGDYSVKALAPKLIAVSTETAQLVAPVVAGRSHIVVFAVNVDHAQSLAEAFTSAGVSAATVWGEQPHADRDEVLRAWRSGEVRALVNVGIVTEGFDEPLISAVVMARPTSSTLFYLQAVGRGLRIAPGKADCLVIDCVGLGKLRDARQCVLDALVPEIAALSPATGVAQEPGVYHGRKLVSDPAADTRYCWLNFGLDVYGFNISDKEWAFVQRDARTGLFQASHHNLDEISAGPIAIGDAGPFSSVSNDVRLYLKSLPAAFGLKSARWRKEPATDGQIRYLGGYNSERAREALREGWTRGEVSDAISFYKGKSAAYRAGLMPGGSPRPFVAQAQPRLEMAS